MYLHRRTKRYRNDLNALMLTQGWRKYIYSKPLEKNAFPFYSEPTLTVLGNVGGALFKKRKKQVELTMLTFGTNRSVYTQGTYSLGRFSFNLNDEYGQNLNIIHPITKTLNEQTNKCPICVLWFIGN